VRRGLRVLRTPEVSGCLPDGDRPPAARPSGGGAPARNRTRCTLVVSEEQPSRPRTLQKKGLHPQDVDRYNGEVVGEE
jgi:hypothetical protein